MIMAMLHTTCDNHQKDLLSGVEVHYTAILL